MFPSNYYAASGNWAAKTVSVAADRYKFLAPDYEALKINSGMYGRTGSLIPDLSQAATWDTLVGTDGTVAANRAGKDIYVYHCEPTSGLAPVVLVSFNASAPSGYTVANSRLIASAHCLCVAVNHQTTLTAWAANTAIALGCTRKSTVWNGKIIRCTTAGTTHATTEPEVAAAVVGSTITDGTVTWLVEQHALEGYVAGDILPASVGSIHTWPDFITPSGMVFVPSVGWVDIYLPSGLQTSPVSVYGGTVLHNQTFYHAQKNLNTVYKRPWTMGEFMAAAYGSNASVLNGGVDPLTAGGRVDAYGRRAVSSWGVEEACGSHHQWAENVSGASIYLVGGASNDANAGPLYFTAAGSTSSTTTITYRGCASRKSG
jgi:hypothetical protein